MDKPVAVEELFAAVEDELGPPSSAAVGGRCVSGLRRNCNFKR